MGSDPIFRKRGLTPFSVVGGVRVEVGPEAVVVRSARPFTALSSAVVGGGLVRARSVINLHVAKNDPCEDPAGMLRAYARRAGVPGPWVGLLTAAWTERAVRAWCRAPGLGALAVVTVGLGNRAAAGRSRPGPWSPGTINLIVVVEADPEPAALVNLVATATEAKTLALVEAGITHGRRQPATGTSSDAILVAATGRGPRARYGGPRSPLGWVAARAAGSALRRGIARWQSRQRP
jgi:adenosylcobinamide amidohydrolase